MGKSVRNALTERRELIRQTVNEVEKKLTLLPEGRIEVKTVKGSAYYYYCGKNAKQKYLSDGDSELIKALIQKAYLKDVLKSAKQELTALDRMLKIYPETLPEELFEKLPEGRKKHATPIIPGAEKTAQEWMDAPYTRKPFKKDAPYFLTQRGERVRSKSEMIIADRLYANGIPYRYECPLKVGSAVIHPDFSILRMSDMKVVYHEHCGKMDDPEYTEDMVSRVNTYNQAGIIQGDKLTFSFETTAVPLDVRVIDRLINEYFK